jgi:predicted RNA-binding Zn ribbon-like protein
MSSQAGAPATPDAPGVLARYVPVTAPGGLALVQGILNTRSTASGSTDLLDDVAPAQAWLTDGLAEWAERTGSVAAPMRVSAPELLDLRALRDRVRRYVDGDRTGTAIDVPISIVAEPDGTLRTQPTGTGMAWLESALWGAVLMAQDRDTLRRLKLCRNSYCGSAFYDRSKNNSGVWHDVRTCGNLVNLRASRARKRGAGAD